jgi:SAM-dependent methyltransferase
LNDELQGDYPQQAFEGWAAFERANRYWFRARERLIGWALDRWFADARTMLEAGCGAGSVLAQLRASRPGLSLVGTDSSPRALELAAARAPSARLELADARELPFDAEFDVAGAFDVIEHLDDDAGALASLRRAVRPGGGVILTVPQHPRLWSAFDEYAGHKRRYRRRELLERIAAADLELVHVTSFITAPLPAMALSRARARGGGGYDPVAEGSEPPPLAGVLDRVLAAEALVVRRGVSLPAGGSLLAVARRMPTRTHR